MGKKCSYCEGEPEAGWLELGNNGPIVPCPVCNPKTEKELAWDMAERQRAMQRDQSKPLLSPPIGDK